jgi:hypothetical protein
MSPRIDSQPGRSVRQPYLSYRPARLRRLVESIPGLHKRLQIQAQLCPSTVHVQIVSAQIVSAQFVSAHIVSAQIVSGTNCIGNKLYRLPFKIPNSKQ